MPRRLIYVLHPRDNVATALIDLAAGTRLSVDSRPGEATREIELPAAVAFGHKLALAPIARGEPVIKYGEVIGLATAAIQPGEHVHIHNVESQRGRGDLAPGPAAHPAP